MTIPPGSPPSSEPTPIEVVASPRQSERRALGFLALLALVSLIRLAMPIGVGLFLGALLAFTLEPLYARLRRREMGAGPAALLCALGATLSMFVVAFGMTTLLVSNGITLFGEARDLVSSGGALRAYIDSANTRLAAFHINVDELTHKLEDAVLAVGSRMAGVAAEVAGLTFGALLTFFFITMATYFVLRHWTEIVARAERLLPIERRHTHALLDQFRIVGRQVLLGTVVTGLVQGVFAAFGYWITGVQAPAFWGILTAVASLIPGIGTVLVWATIGAVMMLTGHVGAGLAELIYAALTVGIVSDYVIRPRLVGSEKGVPAILTFVALFGGVEVFGVIGLILGPVIATLSLAVLKTYAREVTEQAVAAKKAAAGLPSPGPEIARQ